MTDWEELLTEATARVEEACSSISSKEERAKLVGRGASGDDTLVADREAERLILERLLSVRDLRVLSEEAGDVGPKNAKYLAVIDPLDGSSNFSRGIPFYCTSVCVIEGKTLEGAKRALVRNLVTGDVYYAEEGVGAWKNKRPLHPSRTADISLSVAAVDLSKAGVEVIRWLEPLLGSVRRHVHLGANALELCMVADGSVDAFVDVRGRMRVTDLAGAYLVVREAGCYLTTETGKELDPPLDLSGGIRAVASSNAGLHSGLLKALATFRGRVP